MGIGVKEDLEKINQVLIQVDSNIRELQIGVEHLHGKIMYYRKILSKKHRFNIEAMNREIDTAKAEIAKTEKIIDGEKKRRKYYQEIARTLYGIQK